MGDLDPVTLDADDGEVVPDPVRLDPPASPDTMRDRDALRDHREKLLAMQGLSAAGPAVTSPRSALGELALAVVYTAYFVPMAYFTAKLGVVDGEILWSVGVLTFAIVVLLGFWRSYRRAFRRARVYDGVLVECRRFASEADGADAVFGGGRTRLPHALARELVPGVRYRVFAPDTDDVVVDVAVDDVAEALTATAYR